ncbi:MAG: phage head-tail adapter protein [Lachnospiraceae bacterium]|nr:phage head-tail adapter protein [Lachnospiraceae bacterium]
MDGVATLIKETYAQDEIGQMIPSETGTEIYVEIGSVTRGEWAAASRDGLNPAIVLRTQRVNYSGERIVEIGGVRYGIYRTYAPPDSDDIELYLEEKAGVTG